MLKGTGPSDGIVDLLNAVGTVMAVFALACFIVYVGSHYWRGKEVGNPALLLCTASALVAAILALAATKGGYVALQRMWPG